MKDLDEIAEGVLSIKLNEVANKLSKHFFECEQCLGQRKVCKWCKDEGQKFFVFQYEKYWKCEKCRQIFHKECGRQTKSDVCLQCAGQV